MHAYFHKSPELLEFIQDQLLEDSHAVDAVLYSTDGFEARKRIKKNLQDRINGLNCYLCFLTCGFSICFKEYCGQCCCCLDDQRLNELQNEEYYYSQVEEQYRDKVDTKAYIFILDEE